MGYECFVTSKCITFLPLHLGLTQHCADFKYLINVAGTSPGLIGMLCNLMARAASSKRDAGCNVMSLTNLTTRGLSRRLN